MPLPKVRTRRWKAETGSAAPACPVVSGIVRPNHAIRTHIVSGRQVRSVSHAARGKGTESEPFRSPSGLPSAAEHTRSTRRVRDEIGLYPIAPVGPMGMGRSYILRYTSSNGTLHRSPQMPFSPSRMPQGMTMLISAPQGRFSSFFSRLLSSPSSGHVS